MYIPDKIKVRMTASRFEVYSADEGQQSDEPMEIMSCQMEWTWRSGYEVQVRFGSSVFRLGDTEQCPVFRAYKGSSVTFLTS